MMNWPDEHWVKLYTRDTAAWMMLTFEAQALFVLLLRKVDRAGVLELDPQHVAVSIAAVLGHAHRHEQIGLALAELERDGCVAVTNGRLVIRNFLEAQSARMSDRLRASEMRARRRDAAATVTNRDAPITNRDAPVTARDAPVTPCHTTSRIEENRLEKEHVSASQPTLAGLESEQSSDEKAHAHRARTDARDWVAWFNKAFGRQFTVNKQLIATVRTLHTRGFAYLDMVEVATYLRTQWQDDPKMRSYLVPSTILRTEKFAERRDLAREHASKRTATVKRLEQSKVPTVSIARATPPNAEYVSPSELLNLANGVLGKLKGNGG